MVIPEEFVLSVFIHQTNLQKLFIFQNPITNH